MNLFNTTALCLAAATASAAVGSTASAQVNLFANGGFETAGDTTPALGWDPAAAGYTLSSDARTGSFAAQLASPALNAAVLLQNSVEGGLQAPLVVGDTPEFSFWAKGTAGTTGNVLYALRYLNDDGVILADSGNQFFQGAINEAAYTQITFNLGAVPEGATSAFVEFSQAIGPIDPGAGLTAGLVLIDDVALTSSIIPEPTSLALLGLGGLALAARRRRAAR